MLYNAALAVLTFGVIWTWVRFPEAWGQALRWLHVLWVCRVSVVSALAGLVLMATIPQAQDVFADTSVPWSYWAAFFALAFFVWALPVHYGARRILNRQEWAL